MKLVLCAYGTKFSSEWVTEFVNLIAKLMQQGHSIHLRIPPSSLSKTDLLSWIFGTDDEKFDIKSFDRVIVVDHTVIPAASGISSLLESGYPVTAGLHVTETGREVSAVEKFSEADIGNKDAPFTSITVDENTERYKKVDMCGMGVFICNTKESIDLIDLKKLHSRRFVKNDFGEFTLDPMSALCMMFIDENVGVYVDTTARFVKFAQSLVAIKPANEAPVPAEVADVTGAGEAAVE